MSQGTQKDVSKFDQKPQDPNCSGRQFADNPYGSNYDDNKFDQWNNVTAVNPEFHETNATPGDGQFRSSRTAMDEGNSEAARLREFNVISNEDAQSGFISKRSVHFVGPDPRSDGRYGDDGLGPVIWPVDRPQSGAPDFGDQLKRNDVEGRAFGKGKR